jgi:hypothetical protein
MSFVIIILTTYIDLRATKPLISRFTMELIVFLKGLIFSNRLTLLLEIIFSFYYSLVLDCNNQHSTKLFTDTYRDIDLALA